MNDEPQRRSARPVQGKCCRSKTLEEEPPRIGPLPFEFVADWVDLLQVAVQEEKRIQTPWPGLFDPSQRMNPKREDVGPSIVLDLCMRYGVTITAKKEATT